MSSALSEYPVLVNKKVHPLATNIKKHMFLYIMVLPGVLWFILFRYIPFLGSVIAFQDYKIFLGVSGSKWVGLRHFQALFQYEYFWRLLRNTLLLALYGLLLGFPVPILLALGINEIRSSTLKRSVQTILYLPHFLSWVIIAGLFFRVFGLAGPVNGLIQTLGGKPILFLQESWFFRPAVVIATVWRNGGWGTIIYLAAIAGINPELYEAAMVDGAGKLQRIFHITIPSLMPTAVVLFLLEIGRFMNLGFERVWNFLTPLTYSVGDIFDTFVYRVGIGEGQYSSTTAIGLFQSLVGFVLIIGFNRLTRKISGGLW